MIVNGQMFVDNGSTMTLKKTSNTAECDYLSWFMQLPDELQIKILGFLPVQDLLKATAVCRKWKRLAFDGSMWTKVDVTPFYKIIPAEQILRLGVAAGTFLKVANFRGCIQLTGHGLRTLSDHCPNVQILHLKDCRRLSTPSIAHFLQNMRQLRVLDLSGLDSVKNSTLQVVADLAQLEKLNLGWCRNISGQGVQAVAQGCQALQYLKLNGCPQLDETTMATIGQLPFLSHLCLAYCTSLTDGGLLEFFQSSSGPLTHLNLSSCTRLTDASLRHIALHCKRLSHLELAGCVLLTDQGFCYLAPRLRTFVNLDLEDLQQITGITVKALANSQPQLRRLCVSNCTQIADDAVIHLILHGVCHQLQHLELDNCTVTDEVLNSIAVFLTQPPSLDSTFSFFSSSSEPKAERKLSVEVLDCSNITEKGVRSALAKAGPMLSIKSFYSWREDESQTGEEDMFQETGRRRYNTVGRQRRRRGLSTAGQPFAASCIIL
ncbi:hypothetical protein DFQ28_002168 [Apophysomyces sp. BC1034]|nr:hypothetical protein DFQ30_001857 [Apophysomyces sp. BC1015]KAG0180498.1 hypothetical protein DFQ29_000587 [Apophysomyces sp. BC1021]KAG0190353.1 hypothetical protein DFQ28_002168 [Apophysomyces sp. BC1034]